MISVSPATHANDRLVRAVHARSPLSSVEIEALRALPLATKTIAEHADVLREGARPTDCCLLVDGVLARYKAMPEGGRQILSLHVPGDIPDLQSLYLTTMDHALGALSQSRVAMIPHAALLELIRVHPGIAAALWRGTLIDAAVFREWICNTGHRSAFQRAAHLLCEFFVKMDHAGLVRAGSCEFPMTQQDLGDALGLSVVHVNRTLQQLRATGAIVLKGKQLTVPDLDRLQDIAAFDPKYLYIAAA